MKTIQDVLKECSFFANFKSEQKNRFEIKKCLTQKLLSEKDPELKKQIYEKLKNFGGV